MLSLTRGCRLDQGLALCRDLQFVSKIEPFERVERDIHVANSVVGKVRQKREAQMLTAVERVCSLAVIDEPNTLRLESITNRLHRGRLVNLADVPGVGFGGGERVQHVPTSHLVFECRRKRFEQNHSRKVRLGLQQIHLVRIGQARIDQSVRAHEG
ncbi:unannotated protein [freshwater metagenome]|uniref:Unannotated protein n=1 Tax=freshwater metagenome TaxID=449393 RepID=A0A6J6R5A3_9ZZZZ